MKTTVFLATIIINLSLSNFVRASDCADEVPYFYFPEKRLARLLMPVDQISYDQARHIHPNANPEQIQEILASDFLQSRGLKLAPSSQISKAVEDVLWGVREQGVPRGKRIFGFLTDGIRISVADAQNGVLSIVSYQIVDPMLEKTVLDELAQKQKANLESWLNDLVSSLIELNQTDNQTFNPRYMTEVIGDLMAQERQVSIQWAGKTPEEVSKLIEEALKLTLRRRALL